MTLEERLRQIEEVAQQPGGVILRSVSRLTAGQPDLLRALEIAAVPHWWNDSLLAKLLDADLAPNAALWANALRELSIVEPFLAFEGASNVHEVAREALRSKLHREHRLAVLSTRVLSASDPLPDCSSPTITIEMLYHQLLADPHTGAESLEKQWRTWDDNGRWASLNEMAGMLEELLPYLAPEAEARALLRCATIRATRRTTPEVAGQAAKSAKIFAQLGEERGRAQALNLLGSILTTNGNLPEAEIHFNEALAIRERLAASFPTNPTYQRDLSVSHGKLGTLDVAGSRLSDAAEHFVKSLAITERLVAHDPNNVSRQRDLSVCHNKQGTLGAAQGDAFAAESHFVAALMIRERLAAMDHTNAAWQRDLAVSHIKLGSLYLDTADLLAAERHFRESLQIREHLVSGDPSNAAWQYDLGMAWEWLGRVAQARGELGEAEACYKRKLAIANRLTTTSPNNLAWLYDLSIANELLGSVAAALGQVNQADAYYAKRNTIVEHLASSGWGGEGWERDLFYSC